MIRTRRTIMLVALLLALTGCGASDEDEAGGAAREYIRAFADKDTDTACSLLSASAKTDVVNYISAQVPELGTTKCEDVFAQLLDLIDEGVLAQLSEVEVDTVEINGDEAIVRLQGAPMPAVMTKIEGEWLISELDFEGTGGTAAAPTTEPTEEPTEEPTPEPTPDEGAAEVARVQGRLEGAGFKVRKAGGGSGAPKPVGTLEVDVGDSTNAQVTVYLMASAADAADLERQLAVVEKEQPDQLDLETIGENVYIGTVEEPATFPADQFEAVIAAAEG